MITIQQPYIIWSVCFSYRVTSLQTSPAGLLEATLQLIDLARLKGPVPCIAAAVLDGAVACRDHGIVRGSGNSDGIASDIAGSTATLLMGEIAKFGEILPISSGS